MALKWGIASSGKIAHEFVLALRAYPKSEHTVTAVAARSLDSATKFANNLDIPNAYGGYEHLGDDPDVDVVYVAVLNHKHYEVTKMLLEKGKHVLCEKPLTLNEKQTRTLIALARERNLFLMEGLWLRCFPAYREMKRLIDAGEIGDVMHVCANMGMVRMHQDRLRLKEFGGGVTLTMGVYLLAFQQYFLKGLKPIKLVANGHLNEDGVDTTATAVTTYPGNRLATVSVSGLVSFDFQNFVYGTKGKIIMSNTTSFNINGEDKEFPLISNPDNDKFDNPFFAGLAYEADEVRTCMRDGKIESPQMTHADSIEVASLMDKVRAELGVVYDADFEDY